MPSMPKKYIEDNINVTSKGTCTLPVKFRRALGIAEKGAQLKIRFSFSTGEVVISKVMEFSEIQELSSKFLNKNREPLTDVGGFYRKSGDK